MTGTTPAYRAQRARAMAYGTWRPWAEDPDRVREHVRQLRECGASYEAIGKAAGIATMAVHALMNGGGRVRTETAEALMGLTPQRLDLVRVPARGAQLRVRGLVAMGHSYTRIARALGCHFETVQRLGRGDVATAPAGLEADVGRVYEAWWNKTPPERTKGEHMAAEAARHRAERAGWCTGGGLDDARIDDPSYVPQASWRRAEGTGIAPDDPLGRQRQRWAEGPNAGPDHARETQMKAGEPPAGKGNSLDITEYDADGNAAAGADYDADAAQYEHDPGSGQLAGFDPTAQEASERQQGAALAHTLIVRGAEAGRSADWLAGKHEELLGQLAPDAEQTPAEREWLAGFRDEAEGTLATLRDVERADAAERDARAAERDYDAYADRYGRAEAEAAEDARRDAHPELAEREAEAG